MQDIRSEWRGLTHTLGVLSGGVLLSFVLAAGLERLLQPNLPQLIVEAQRTSPGEPQWHHIWGELQRFASVTVYVVDPLMGFGVGTFMGLLQKRRPGTLAALCLIPQFLVGVLTDHRRNWARSTPGVLHYLINNSLPFIAAIVAAMLSRYLVDFLGQRQYRSRSEA